MEKERHVLTWLNKTKRAEKSKKKQYKTMKTQVNEKEA